MPSAKAAKEPTPFMVLDLKYLLLGRGIGMAGVPYQVACDGEPTGGTYTGQPGERVFLTSCEDEPSHLQRMWLGEGMKCFRRNREGNWVGWNPPRKVLDFTQPGWDGWTAVRVEGIGFTTEWINAEGHTWAAGSAAE